MFTGLYLLLFRIDPLTATNVDLQDVKIVKQVGGTMDDTELVRGLVLERGVRFLACLHTYIHTYPYDVQLVYVLFLIFKPYYIHCMETPMNVWHVMILYGTLPRGKKNVQYCRICRRSILREVRPK